MPLIGDIIEDVAVGPYRFFLHIFGSKYMSLSRPHAVVTLCGFISIASSKVSSASRLWLKAASEPKMVAQLKARTRFYPVRVRQPLP